MNKLLKYENSKLKKQLIFNLPVSKEVCGRECPGCYALKPQKRFPAVLNSRNVKYDASLQSSFVERISTEIQKKRSPIKALRIHESGEFYSQEYINKWEQIASKNPDTTFYAFTKRKEDFDFSKIEKRNNVVIIDSLKHGKINYGTEGYLAKHPTTIVCPATTPSTQDTTICGVTCDYCMTKQAQVDGVLFLQH